MVPFPYFKTSQKEITRQSSLYHLQTQPLSEIMSSDVKEATVPFPPREKEKKNKATRFYILIFLFFDHVVRDWGLVAGTGRIQIDWD
jgi:hypothetical protein